MSYGADQDDSYFFFCFTASADDFISDISPAVIFVAVTGGVFLCLVGLLFLPTSQRSLQN